MSLYSLITGNADLQDYWPLDDGSGSAPADTQGTPGTIHGSPSWNPPLPQVDGRGALLLNTPGDAEGTGDYVQSAYQYSLASTGAIELWWYPPDPAAVNNAGGLHLLAGFVGGDPDPIDVQVAQALLSRYNLGHWQVVMMLTVVSGGQYYEATKLATTNLVPGQWNYLVASWNPTTGTVYVNGTAAGSFTAVDWDSDTGNFEFSNFTTADFKIGGGYHGGTPSPTIDGALGAFCNVATYYGYELTSGDVSSRYAAGTPPSGTAVSASTDLRLGLAAYTAPPVYGGPMRVTQFYAEVLASVRWKAYWPVAASTGLYAGVQAHVVKPYDIGAATGLQIGVPVRTRPLIAMTATTGLRVGEGAARTPLWYVAGDTGLRLGEVGHEVRDVPGNASTGLYAGLVAHTTRPWPVSASTGLYAGLVAHTTRPYAVAASTDLYAGLVAHLGRPWGVAATTDLYGGVVASPWDPQEYDVAAATDLEVGLADGCYATQRYHLAAATDLAIGSAGGAVLKLPFFLTAGTDLRIGEVAVGHVPTSYVVVAGTSLRLTLATGTPGSVAVAATSDIQVQLDVDYDLISTYVYVTAATELRLGAVGRLAMNPAWHVGAATELWAGSKAGKSRAHTWALQAVTSARVGSAGAEVREIHPGATTGLLTGVATRKGREIHVSATTGFMSGVGESRTPLVSMAGTTALRVGDAAGAVVTGTEAETAIGLAHLALAELWLPWRRDEPILPVGGQIPH